MRQSTTAPATVLLLALVSCACARSDEEWERDLVKPRSDDFHRGMAALTLAEQAPERARGLVRPLLALLDGPSGPLRPHADEALRKIAPWSIDELVQIRFETAFLSDGSRRSLEEAIISAGDRAVPPLLAALRAPDRPSARQIADVLGRIGEPAVDPLLQIVREDPGSRSAAHAIRALGGCGPVARRALPVLLGILQGGDPILAPTVPASLWQIDPRGEVVLPALREALSDPRDPLRIEAARAITHLLVARASALGAVERVAALREVVRFGEPIHPSLFEELASPGTERERAARECLMAIAARWTVLPPSARVPTPPLDRMCADLDERSEALRRSATFDLGRKGAAAAPALRLLVAALHDRDAGVRFGASLALAVISVDLARARLREGGAIPASRTGR